MNADIVRFVIFIGVFVALAMVEDRWPRRGRKQSRTKRWFINLALTFFNGFLLKLVLGAAAVGTAFYAREHGWGLFNAFNVPAIPAFILTILFLDFMIYLQHVMVHALPLLWRFHLVHHTDIDFDVSTALRFHPVEILISMIYKIGLVAAIGAHPWAVVVFEVILNASAQFNHSNLNLPEEWDRKLRRVIITPDFHRVHHSVVVEETNSNFGFFLSWWDMLAGTYRPQPSMEHQAMPIGITEYRDGDELTLPYLLTLPARPKMGDYSMDASRTEEDTLSKP